MARQCIRFTTEENAAMLSPDFTVAEFMKRFNRPNGAVHDHIRNLRKNGHTILGRGYNNTLTLKDYNKAIKKSFVQDLIFKMCEGIHGEMACMLGPNPERYLALVRKYVTIGKHMINSYELDIDIYCKQFNMFIKQWDVDVNNESVFETWTTPYMDFDLMCKWKKEKNKLKYFFESQAKYFPTQSTAFNFTVSLRADKREIRTQTVEEILSSLLKTPCKVIQENLHVVIKKKTPVIEYIVEADTNYKIAVYHYADKTPMMSFSISKLQVPGIVN